MLVDDRSMYKGIPESDLRRYADYVPVFKSSTFDEAIVGPNGDVKWICAPERRVVEGWSSFSDLIEAFDKALKNDLPLDSYTFR